MTYSMQLKLYMIYMQGLSNQPVSLARVLKPFHLCLSEHEESHYLMVGHIIEDLCDQMSVNDRIDPLDIASSAWELGFEPARKFLEQGPHLIYRLMKDENALEKFENQFF